MINKKEILDALSLERFSRYLDWAEGDEVAALELYTLNTQLSEALYTPLQMLEVALRNRIHTVMTEAHHEGWFDEEGILLLESQLEQIEKARADLKEGGKKPIPGRIVAALTFSFWTSMLSPKYEDLWQKRLNRIARTLEGKGLTRKKLSDPLARIRTLRNRIAHHEPIIYWNLPKHYAAMIEITEWLSPPAAIWCRTYSRFDDVYPEEQIVLKIENDR